MNPPLVSIIVPFYNIDRLIADYNGPISFKVLHHDHNRCLSAVRNTGMDAVTRDYLFFMDSDEELTDDCLEMGH